MTEGQHEGKAPGPGWRGPTATPRGPRGPGPAALAQLLRPCRCPACLLGTWSPARLGCPFSSPSWGAPGGPATPAASQAPQRAWRSRVECALPRPWVCSSGKIRDRDRVAALPNSPGPRLGKGALLRALRHEGLALGPLSGAEDTEVGDSAAPSRGAVVSGFH